MKKSETNRRTGNIRRTKPKRRYHDRRGEAAEAAQTDRMKRELIDALRLQLRQEHEALECERHRADEAEKNAGRMAVSAMHVIVAMLRRVGGASTFTMGEWEKARDQVIETRYDGHTISVWIKR